MYLQIKDVYLNAYQSTVNKSKRIMFYQIEIDLVKSRKNDMIYYQYYTNKIYI
jgi:hypothetical protein